MVTTMYAYARSGFAMEAMQLTMNKDYINEHH